MTPMCLLANSSVDGTRSNSKSQSERGLGLECSANVASCSFVAIHSLQYNDLMKKKRIVENDKAKILQTIKELDQKKNQALNLAWQKVRSPCLLVWSIYCIPMTGI